MQPHAEQKGNRHAPSDHQDVDDAGPLMYLMHSVDAETGLANRVGRDGVMAGPDGSGVHHG